MLEKRLLNCQLHLQYKLRLVCEDSQIHTVDKSSRTQGWHFLIILFKINLIQKISWIDPF